MLKKYTFHSTSSKTDGCDVQTHLMTVGVISAQKKMLSVLTAWEENMPMMEKATENFLFRVSLRTAQKTASIHQNTNQSRKIKV